MSIIGILASILLPSLTRARQVTQRAACQSNLKQIALGLEFYSDDNKDFFPRFNGNYNVIGYGKNSRRPLNKYLESAKVARCPSDSGDPKDEIDIVWEQEGSSYQMAAQKVQFGVDYTSHQDDPRKRSYFSESTKKLVIGDLWHANRDWKDSRMQWHGGKNARSCNMLFLDSHVEFFKFPEEYNSFKKKEAPDVSRGWY